MKKILPLSLSGLVAVTLWMPVTLVNAAGTSIEQRLLRLERMTENPVLLQLSRRLGEQQREIQELHDAIDRLKRDLHNANLKSDKRYKESDDRLSALESGLTINKQTPSATMSKVELPVKSSEIQSTNSIKEVSSVENPATTSTSLVSDIAPVLPTTESDSSLAVSDATLNKTAVIESGNQALASLDFKEKMTDQTLNTHSQLQEGLTPIESKVDEVIVGPIKTTPATDLEKEQYQKAFARMKAAQYDNAINAFEQFLSTYPQSELASNAAYWAGEGHLIKKQNQAALDSFMIVIERYPNAYKRADAQLRAADSLANLKRFEEAKKMYQNVINGRPHSRAAQMASKRLNGLK